MPACAAGSLPSMYQLGNDEFSNDPIRSNSSILDNVLKFVKICTIVRIETSTNVKHKDFL